MDDDKFLRKLSSLGEISKLQLSKILHSCESPKDLFLEPRIIKPLERICGVRWLKANDVEKIYKIENNGVKSYAKSEIYMIYSNYQTFQNVVKIIQSKIDPLIPVKNRFHIIIVPKVLSVYEDLLEENGLYGDIIKLYSLQWMPIHVDKYILSLETPDMYKNLFVNGEYSHLSSYSKALWQIFLVFGQPKFTLALGNLSNSVLNQLKIFQDELGEGDKIGQSEFGSLVLMDRNADYPSVLLTPGTYTALLNEIYQIKCGIIDYKKPEDVKKYDKKNNLIPEKLPLNLPLDSRRDTVYNNIKNRYFTEVTTVLSNLTKQLRTEGESSKEMALDEIKIYVKTKLQEATSKKKLITNHLAAAESIINVLGPRFERQQGIERNIITNTSRSGNFAFLEELVTTDNDKNVSLRLMCLLSLTQKLSESELKSFWTKYILEYGYKYGYVYNNLIRANFVPEPSTDKFANKMKNINKISQLLTNNFYTTMNKLKQIPLNPEKIDLKAPTSCSYVFGGYYIPLISVIASMLASNTPIEEIKTKLDLITSTTTTIINDKGYPLESRSLLICIIGGISYAEIAACNLLEVLTQTKITILTDRVISGNDIMESLF